MDGRVRSLALAGALLAASVGCSCSDETGDARGGGVAARDAAAETRVRAAGETPEAAEAAAQAAAAARPRHALNGTVRTYDGRALAGAVIRAEPVAVFPHAPDPRTPSETTADAAGAFALPALEAGDWALLVSAEGALGTYVATVRVPERTRFDVVLPRGSVIEGTVIDDATRAPVSNARVRLRGASRRWIGDARTSADGRFAMALFEEAPQGAWHVEGYASELAESSSTSVAFGVLGRHEVTLVAQRGRTLAGRVVGPEGPIASAHVTLRRGGSSDPEDIREATTGADGGYEMSRLAPDADSLWITVDAAGFVQEGECDPDVSDGEPPTGDNVDPQKTGWTAPDIRMRKRLPIGRCTIAGVVVDEEEHPVAGVALVTQHRVGAATATSDEGGAFQLADVATEAEDGSVSIRCVTEGDWQGDASVETSAGASVRDVVVVVGRIERLHVRGHVLAPDRTPVARARVVVVPFRTEAMGCVFGRLPDRDVPPNGTQGVSGPDGTFDVAFVPGQNVAVLVEAPELMRWTAAYGPSELPDSIEVALEASCVVTGRVVRSGTESGVPGLDVAIFSFDRGFAEHDYRDDPTYLAGFASRVVATTAADGSFRVEGVRTTDMLDIVGPGWIRSEVELADRSLSEPLRVEIEPSLALAGRAQFADGRPCAGVDVAVYEVDPGEHDTAREERESGDSVGDRRFRAAADGTFWCDRLVTGKYWLEFTGGTPQVIRRVAGPFDAGTRDVVVDLVRGATIRGRVVRPDGSGAKDVRVLTIPIERDGPEGATTTNRDGAFAIGGLDEGPYSVAVAAEGFFTWTRSNVRATDEALEVRLDAGLAVAGVVRDSSGEAMAYVDLVVEPAEPEKPDETRKGRTDEDGRFRIAALTKGRWRIRLSADSRDERFEPVVVEAGSEALELRTVPRPPAPPVEQPPADDAR